MYTVSVNFFYVSPSFSSSQNSFDSSEAGFYLTALYPKTPFFSKCSQTLTQDKFSPSYVTVNLSYSFSYYESVSVSLFHQSVTFNVPTLKFQPDPPGDLPRAPDWCNRDEPPRDPRQTAHRRPKSYNHDLGRQGTALNLPFISFTPRNLVLFPLQITCK